MLVVMNQFDVEIMIIQNLTKDSFRRQAYYTSSTQNKLNFKVEHLFLFFRQSKETIIIDQYKMTCSNNHNFKAIDRAPKCLPFHRKLCRLILLIFVFCTFRKKTNSSSNATIYVYMCGWVCECWGGCAFRVWGGVNHIPNKKFLCFAMLPIIFR